MNVLRGYILSSCLLCVILTSCTQNTPYYHFEEVSSEGWDKEDTIHFSVDTLKESGKYTLTLDIRTTNLYPYQNLSLMVEETVYPYNTRREFPVHLQTATSDGQHTGMGLSQHSLCRLLTCQYLHHGDSIHLKVYHKMRRLVLPGITDIGIKVER